MKLHRLPRPVSTAVTAAVLVGLGGTAVAQAGELDPTAVVVLDESLTDDDTDEDPRSEDGDDTAASDAGPDGSENAPTDEIASTRTDDTEASVEGGTVE
ncbi:MAG TPA: hypothetical protein VGC57_12580, partial [Cellulomonas sp.]